jgi:putrescine transport system permease protein
VSPPFPPIATLLGTLAAVGLVRGERFGGRSLFSGVLYAPLVMRR